MIVFFYLNNVVTFPIQGTIKGLTNVYYVDTYAFIQGSSNKQAFIASFDPSQTCLNPIKSPVSTKLIVNTTILTIDILTPISTNGTYTFNFYQISTPSIITSSWVVSYCSSTLSLNTAAIANQTHFKQADGDYA